MALEDPLKSTFLESPASESFKVLLRPWLRSNGVEVSDSLGDSMPERTGLFELDMST